MMEVLELEQEEEIRPHETSLTRLVLARVVAALPQHMAVSLWLTGPASSFWRGYASGLINGGVAS